MQQKYNDVVNAEYVQTARDPEKKRIVVVGDSMIRVGKTGKAGDCFSDELKSMLPTNWELVSITGVPGGGLNDLATLLMKDVQGREHMNETIYLIYHACNDLFKFVKTGATGKNKKKLKSCTKDLPPSTWPAPPDLGKLFPS